MNNLEQFIWYKTKNNKVINKWNDYTDSLMDSEEAEYWADLGSWALLRDYEERVTPRWLHKCEDA